MKRNRRRPSPWRSSARRDSHETVLTRFEALCTAPDLDLGFELHPDVSDTPVIEIDAVDGTYYICIWFLGGKRRDVLASLMQARSGTIRLAFRFRYHVDNKIGTGSRDVKKVYRAVFSADTSAEVAVERIDNLLRMLVTAGFGDDLIKTPINGNGWRLAEELRKQRFAHFLSFENN